MGGRLAHQGCNLAGYGAGEQSTGALSTGGAPSVGAAEGFAFAVLTFVPSLPLPLRCSRTTRALESRSPEEDIQASEILVSMKIVAHVAVARVRRLPAPRPPKTCWVAPPKRRSHAAAFALLKQHHEHQKAADEYVKNIEKDSSTWDSHGMLRFTWRRELRPLRRWRRTTWHPGSLRR